MGCPSCEILYAAHRHFPATSGADYMQSGGAGQKVPLIIVLRPFEPRFGVSIIHPHEAEARFPGKLLVHFRIADMVMLVSGKAALHVHESLLV